MNNDDIINLGEADMVPLASQLSQTMQAGLPLESGLRVLAQQTRGRRSRSALSKLSEDLERGVPLPVALKESAAGLPRSMKSLVSVGLETGHLSNVMRYCIERQQWSSSLRRQIWMTMSYPLVLVWTAWMIVGGILIWIVPMFNATMDDFGVELPLLSSVLFSISSFMAGVGWIPWLTITVGYWVFVLFLTQTTWGQRLACRLPLIDRAFHYAAITDLCSILALFVESGVPLQRAMRCSAEVTDDSWIRRRCESVAIRVEDGVPPARAALAADLPNAISHAFRHVHAQQIFAQSLRDLADIYRSRCLAHVQYVNTIIAPYSVGVVLFLIAICETAVFLPLFSVLRDLS